MSFFEQLQSLSFTASDGITLRGWQTKLSGKPIVYFRHANGFNSLTYLPFLEPLAQSFDLIMMDAQGHGDSDRGSRINWQRCSRHALEHIESAYPQWSQQKDIPLYGLGHSFGGILTLLTTGLRPDLFDRTILMDPVLFSRGFRLYNGILNLTGAVHKTRMVSKARNRRAHWPDRASAMQSLLNRGIYKGWDPRALQAYVEHGLVDDSQGVRLKCDPLTEADIFRAQTGPLWPSIKRVSKPMTIITGNNTIPFIQHNCLNASRCNPIIENLSTEGGHCFMLQYPQHAAELITRLLSQP